MANFESMIPFILYCEEGLPKSKLSLPPVELYALIGDKAHIDPNDSGGWTKAGVILSTYAAYRKSKGFAATSVDDLRAMPYEDWRNILKRMFWDRFKADQIATQMVAVACVDWVWGSGITGIKKVQSLLRVKADGVVGRITLAAINSYPDQQDLFDNIQAARNEFHASIAKPRHEKRQVPKRLE